MLAFPKNLTHTFTQTSPSRAQFKKVQLTPGKITYAFSAHLYTRELAHQPPISAEGLKVEFYGIIR